MTELEWLRCIQFICEANAEEAEQIIYSQDFLIGEKARYRLAGMKQAYAHIGEYIKSRIREVERANELEDNVL